MTYLQFMGPYFTLCVCVHLPSCAESRTLGHSTKKQETEKGKLVNVLYMCMQYNAFVKFVLFVFIYILFMEYRQRNWENGIQ